MASVKFGDITLNESTKTWNCADGLGSCFYKILTAQVAQPGVPVKVAGFDFDDTLVTKNGYNVMFPGVVDKLVDLYGKGFRIVIFSNEKVEHLKKSSSKSNAVNEKLSKIDKFLQTMAVKRVLIDAFVATKADVYRKGSTKKDKNGKVDTGGVAMWTTYLQLIGVVDSSIDRANSFYCGDSDGSKQSFSDADKQYAQLLNLKFVLAKDFFKEIKSATASSSSTAAPKPILGTKKTNAPTHKVLVLCGFPGSGKSTFVNSLQSEIAPEALLVVSQDVLKNKENCVKEATHTLALLNTTKRLVVIDRTNIDKSNRKIWLDLAKKYAVPCALVYFKIRKDESRERAMSRSGHPTLTSAKEVDRAYRDLSRSFEEPDIQEGFQDIFVQTDHASAVPDVVNWFVSATWTRQGTSKPVVPSGAPSSSSASVGSTSSASGFMPSFLNSSATPAPPTIPQAKTSNPTVVDLTSSAPDRKLKRTRKEDVEEVFVARKQNKSQTHKLLVLCGLPRCGKSLFCDLLYQELGSESIFFVSRDEIKSMKECVDLCNTTILSGYTSDKLIVIDRTNINSEQRRNWVAFAKKVNIPCAVVRFKVAPSICLGRAADWEVTPGEIDDSSIPVEDVKNKIRFMSQWYKNDFPNLNEGFDALFTETEEESCVEEVLSWFLD